MRIGKRRIGILACALALAGPGARGAVNWDDALVVGRTNGDRCFYGAGEEIVFTLELKGVKGEIPPGEYFLDWERSANDGKTERGRAEASLGKPLVIRTKLDIPGFVKIEANLVDKTGRRVPKKHLWEKRVFFQGGAGVDVAKIPAWPEPKDFDAHWAANRRLIDALPLKVLERTPIPCQNPKLNLWRMKLNAPEGIRPATGYLSIPKDATAARRVKATGILSGYYNSPERCPNWLTNVVDGIRMYINRHGCEVDRPEAYYRQFFKPWPLPQEHFRGMALRGMQMFRYLKTLPEWNGRDLVASGSSGGAMQTFWMAMAEPAISKVEATSAANADIFGFKYGRATCGLARRSEELNYYDICNAARRVTCPVVMNAALGDSTCPPAGLSIVYRNLKGRKQITWHQGCTHGWWPSGMKKETWSSGPADAELAREVAEDVARPVRPGGVDGQPFWNGSSYLFMYPPAFGFAAVAGAAKYRFTAIDDFHRTHEMTAERPTASLAPIWGEIPAGGYVTVVCEGLDAKGASRGVAGRRRFWKTVPFRPGAYPPAARPYAEAAAMACEYIWNLPNTKRLLEKGEPDPAYSLNCYPTKMNAAVIRAMLRYAKLRPARKADALKVARAAADWLLGVSQPEGAPLAHFPPTYRGTANTAKDFAGQNMLLYPASAALAYLELAAATGEAKYRAAAERIGRTYLKLQGADGTWPLKAWEKDGRPVQANRAFPMTQIALFEKLYALTGDAAWRTAGDRAFACIEKGPLANWNWDCQFEDVNPATAYKSLSKHNACSTAIYLLKRFPGDAKRLAQARELLRFAEDQFVYWEPPCRADGAGPRTGTPEGKGIVGWLWDYRTWHTPGVGEQYGWEMPIDASNDKLIRTYLALYAAERRPLDLAKARALGDALVNIQDAKGCIRTQMLKRSDADSIWINCLGATVDALDLLAAEGPAPQPAGAADERDRKILSYLKGRPAEATPRDILANRPDYVVFVPRHASRGRDAKLTPAELAEVGDTYNDHFHVIDDPKRGNLYAFWTQATWEGCADQHIAFSKSSDRGLTWTEPVVLAGSACRATPRPRASWQQPMLAKSGRLYCLWNQQTTSRPPHCGQMFGLYSDDCGASWQGLEQVPFCERMDQDDADPLVPPHWCNWQRPLRLGEGGRFFVGCSRHGKAPYDEKWTCKIEFWQFENIDENPPVGKIRLSHFAKNRDMLSPTKVEPIPGVEYFVPKTDPFGHAEDPAVEEAAIVKLPDGRLFAMMRSSIGCPVWSQSRDGGRTWSGAKALLDAHGKPFPHPRSPCPLYDWKGPEAGSGTYFALVHMKFDRREKTAYQDRGPLYLIAGTFDPAGEQPIRFAEPKLFAPRAHGNSFYTSYTVLDGQGVLWFNDKKYYLLGRKVGAEWF